MRRREKAHRPGCPSLAPSCSCMPDCVIVYVCARARTLHTSLGEEACLVSKCSAALPSVAAPPPEARQGFAGPKYLRPCQDNCYRGLGWGAIEPFDGGVAATRLLHIANCRKSRDRGVATPLERDRGGM